MPEPGDLLETAATRVREWMGAAAATPALALVAGSGLGAMFPATAIPLSIPYGEIPGLARGAAGGGVAGHAGLWRLVELHGKAIFFLAGRRHFYEGWSAAEVTFMMRLLARLGVGAVILTNAAGGVSRRVRVGDLMLIADHLNMVTLGNSDNTVIDAIGPSPAVYDAPMRRRLSESALTERIELREGVYAAMAGPTYETAAEIRMLARLGADAVGMSTVPEALAARREGLRVAAISLISNSYAYPAAAAPNHAEVLARAREGSDRLRRLVETYLAG